MTPTLSPGAIFRVVTSLVASERAELGGGRAWDSLDWTPDTALGADGLALDSLELLAASEVVGRFFRLHETGAERRLLDAATLDSGTLDSGTLDSGTLDSGTLDSGTLGGWARVVAEALAAPAAAGVDGFTFATSGTTGLPKLCRQPMAALDAEARFWRGQLGGRARVVQTVAAHHIYGFLFAVLLPELAGWPVLDARAMSPAALGAALRADDVLVGFPGGLAALLRGGAALPGLCVVSATQRLPEATHAALLALGAGAVIDIYGSSETGGLACRRAPGAAFALLPRWRRGADEDTVEECATGLAVPLPDRVSWETDRLLRPAERRDGAVQVAGINVFPARVAERLRTHPLVADCEVWLDATLPEPRLRARLVPAPGAAAEAVLAAVDKWARIRLRAPERPVGFTVAGGPGEA